MSDPDEIIVSTVTITKVLKPNGAYVVRWDAGDTGESYMDTMAMLEFAKAMVTDKAMHDGDYES